MPTGVYERTPAHCAAISARQRGKKRSALARAHLSAGHMGQTPYVRTPEHRALMSACVRAGLERKRVAFVGFVGESTGIPVVQ
jgi:hypothetical protein